MVQKINLIGGGFQHAYSSSGWSKPKHVEWVKGVESEPISVYVDNSIINADVNKSKKNYAWVAESSSMLVTLIKWIKNNLEFITETFELVFVHDTRLLELSPKFKLVLPNAVPWVSDVGVYKKTKLISMIASNKTMCDGHLYRQEVIQKYSGQLDHYGRGFRGLERKEDGLKEYMFSIAMENDNYDNIFTEKITDCFAMGTIPIFWGSTKIISELFNDDGVIWLDENFNIGDLTPELYYSKIDAINDNHQRALNLPITEDDFYIKHIK